MSMTATSLASLADVIVLIAQANLSERQKQELRSAVRTVARLVDGEPANIAADPAGLRRCLEMIAPEAHGISRGRWANIRSLLRKALGLVRPMMPSRSIVPLLPEWEALTHGLAFYRRGSVLPLLPCLSARVGGRPEGTAADLGAYRDAIHADRLGKNPGRVWDHLTWLWNGCVRDVADWPSITIERKSRRKIYVIPWSDFSPSLKEDVDRFLD